MIYKSLCCSNQITKLLNIEYPISSIEAENLGADALIVTGREAGGHISQHDISTFSLVQQVTSVVNIPVIAAGGIIDGKGAKGMFAMGAQGVYMGTRFIATHENRASATAKQAILMANSEDYLGLEGASPILAFIASDGAHYLNGQMIGICGGMQILA